MSTAAMLVIADSPTTVSRAAGGDAATTFPAFAVSDADLSLRPVLLFRASPDVSGGNVEIEWKLNGSVVLATNYTTGVGRSFHEVVNDNVLQASGNVLEVEATSGLGELTVSDIVLLYRV